MMESPSDNHATAPPLTPPAPVRTSSSSYVPMCCLEPECAIDLNVFTGRQLMGRVVEVVDARTIVFIATVRHKRFRLKGVLDDLDVPNTESLDKDELTQARAIRSMLRQMILGKLVVISLLRWEDRVTMAVSIQIPTNALPQFDQRFGQENLTKFNLPGSSGPLASLKRAAGNFFNKHKTPKYSPLIHRDAQGYVKDTHHQAIKQPDYVSFDGFSASAVTMFDRTVPQSMDLDSLILYRYPHHASKKIPGLLRRNLDTLQLLNLKNWLLNNTDCVAVSSNMPPYHLRAHGHYIKLTQEHRDSLLAEPRAVTS